MRKRLLISFVFLLIFSIVISGSVDLQHIVAGIILSSLIVWFWGDLQLRLPRILSPKELLLFSRCMLMLIGYIIKSNIEVAKILLFSSRSVTPIFLEMDFGIESDWGRVFLATCITITPGTITIDFDPETNMFTIYALTKESGISLYYWRMVTEIRNLERLIRRRETSAVDNDRFYGPDNIDTVKGGHGAHRN